jgi:hypothetical protein
MHDYRERITEHEDWRDGMNRFRKNVLDILKELDERLKEIEESKNA